VELAALSVEAVTAVFGPAGINPGLVSREPLLTPLKNSPLLSSIPLSFTTVQDAHFPKSYDRLVIHIQDVHGHLEAQDNIAQSILALPRPTLIGLEGAAGGFLIPRFRRFPDKKRLHDVSRALLEENRLTGAEFAGLTTGPAHHFWGIETRGLYLEHLRAMKAGVPLEKDLHALLGEMARSADELKPSLYTIALAELDRYVMAYRTGKKELGVYVPFLLARVQGGYPQARRFMEALSLEKSLDFHRAERERTCLVQVLAARVSKEDLKGLLASASYLKEGRLDHEGFYGRLSGLAKKGGVSLSSYPEFQRYTRYVTLVSRVDRKVFLEELDALEDQVSRNLLHSASPQARELFACSRDLALTDKLARHTLSPEEWEQYRRAGNRVAALPDRLKSVGAFKEMWKRLPSLLPEFENFYHAGLYRNDALVSNLLDKMPAGTPRVPALAVLVAGGFHTPGVTQDLREKGVAYITLAPRFKTIPKSDYLDVFRADRTPLHRLVKGDKLSIPAPVALAIEPLAPAAMGRDGAQVLARELAIETESGDVKSGNSGHGISDGDGRKGDTRHSISWWGVVGLAGAMLTSATGMVLVGVYISPESWGPFFFLGVLFIVGLYFVVRQAWDIHGIENVPYSGDQSRRGTRAGIFNAFVLNPDLKEVAAYNTETGLIEARPDFIDRSGALAQFFVFSHEAFHLMGVQDTPGQHWLAYAGQLLPFWTGLVGLGLGAVLGAPWVGSLAGLVVGIGGGLVIVRAAISRLLDYLTEEKRIVAIEGKFLGYFRDKDISGLSTLMERTLLPGRKGRAGKRMLAGLLARQPILSDPTFLGALRTLGESNNSVAKQVEQIIRQAVGKKVDNKKRVGVIIAGGSGTRFFPMGDEGTPKQFMPNFVTKEKGQPEKLIQIAMRRLRAKGGPYTTVIQTARKYIPLVQAAIEEDTEAKKLYAEGRIKIFGEPEAADTNAAVYYAVAKIGKEMGYDHVVEIYPSDHIVPEHDFPGFHESVERLANIAAHMPYLGLIGIAPSDVLAGTGFGHLKMLAALPGFEGLVSALERFVEKPGLKKIQEWIEQGEMDKYLWNGGYYVGSVGSFWEALRQVAGPDVEKITSKNKYDYYTPFKEFEEAIGTPREDTVADSIFQKFVEYKKDGGSSIDIAVAEPLSVRATADDGLGFVGLLVSLGKFSWRDVGSFFEMVNWVQTELDDGRHHRHVPGLSAIVQYHEREGLVTRDENKNVSLGKGIVSSDAVSSGNYIVCPLSGTAVRVHLEDVHDLVVAVNGDKVVVVPKKHDQQVKAIVAALAKEEQYKGYATGNSTDPHATIGYDVDALRNEDVRFNTDAGLVTGYGLVGIEVVRQGEDIVVRNLRSLEYEQESEKIIADVNLRMARGLYAEAISVCMRSLENIKGWIEKNRTGGLTREELVALQVMAMEGIEIARLAKSGGVPEAASLRLTSDPVYHLHVKDQKDKPIEKWTSFIDVSTLAKIDPSAVPPKRVEVTLVENGVGAYNRGAETGAKMAGDLADAQGNLPARHDWYVLYIMRHGLFPVPEGLKESTEQKKISTLHHTSFGLTQVPGSDKAASTGVGHHQGTKIDVKQVTRGRGVQILVKYDQQGNVRDVLRHEAEEGGYLLALPGYYDYVISAGDEPLAFDDVSIDLKELGYSDADIKAKFNGGVDPATKPTKAPYVWVNGKLEPAQGFENLPPARPIQPVSSAIGLRTLYGELNPQVLQSIAQSLMDNGPAMAAPLFRGRRPTPLAFGTSGLRGLVTDITDLETYINTLGYLEYLLEIGGIAKGETVTIARDLRESSPRIAQAVAKAIEDFGCVVEDIGQLPTPALTYYAMQNNRVSIMITGSHIPFDRNGIKFNRRGGEVLKSDEPGINRHVAEVRKREYVKNPGDSPFKDDGYFKDGEGEFALIKKGAKDEAQDMYVRRYTNVFPGDSLKGQRIGVYLHSGVGTALLAEILRRLGAEVYEFGQSDEFIPIDTEAISQITLEKIKKLATDQIDLPEGAQLDAIVSTDGDSDRPLWLGVEYKEGQLNLRFLPGDMMGAVVARGLGIKGVAVPISSNDALDEYLVSEAAIIIKTKIGSPYVIETMQDLAKDDQNSPVAGWEANGGFLLGQDMKYKNGELKALPTRDAVLPLVAVLAASGSMEGTVFDGLPRRFGKADLMDHFPVATSQAMLRMFAVTNQPKNALRFGFPTEGRVEVYDGSGERVAWDESLNRPAAEARETLAKYFDGANGFGDVDWIDYTDGVRVHFSNGDIVHIRPSGNAPQLRCYAVAGTPERAQAIVNAALDEVSGIYRRIQGDLPKPTVVRTVTGRNAGEIFHIPRAQNVVARIMDAATAAVATVAGAVVSNPADLAAQALGADRAPDPEEKVISDYLKDPKPVKLIPFLQHGGKWTWADPRAIADYIRSSMSGIAEAWAGAHPNGMSRLAVGGGEGVGVDQLLDADLEKVLGVETARKFGGFPFLLKLLACRRSLSGQVHPNKTQAMEGRERERKLIAEGKLDSTIAVYVDANHKPEVLLAKSVFYSLYQFRPAKEIERMLKTYFPKKFKDFDGTEDAIKRVFETVMRMNQTELNDLLWPVVQKIRKLNASSAFNENQNEYWVLDDVKNFELGETNMDVGLFLDLLLNVHRVEPGQILFQEAGIPHFYKRGFGFELMANSNNVGRLGLTDKPKNIDEVLRIMDGNPGSYRMARPGTSQPTEQRGSEAYYTFPGVDDFAMAVAPMNSGDVYSSAPEHEVEIIIVDGADDARVAVRAEDGRSVPYSRGEFIFIPFGVEYSVTAETNAVLIKATVPKTASSSFSDTSLLGEVLSSLPVENIKVESFLNTVDQAQERMREDITAVSKQAPQETSILDHPTSGPAEAALLEAQLGGATEGVNYTFRQTLEDIAVESGIRKAEQRLNLLVFALGAQYGKHLSSDDERRDILYALNVAGRRAEKLSSGAASLNLKRNLAVLFHRGMDVGKGGLTLLNGTPSAHTVYMPHEGEAMVFAIEEDNLKAAEDGLDPVFEALFAQLVLETALKEKGQTRLPLQVVSQTDASEADLMRLLTQYAADHDAYKGVKLSGLVEIKTGSSLQTSGAVAFSVTGNFYQSRALLSLIQDSHPTAAGMTVFSSKPKMWDPADFLRLIPLGKTLHEIITDVKNMPLLGSQA
jgi:phosphomannomutase